MHMCVNQLSVHIDRWPDGAAKYFPKVKGYRDENKIECQIHNGELIGADNTWD